MRHLPVFLIVLPLFAGFMIALADILLSRIVKAIVWLCGTAHCLIALILFFGLQDTPIQYALGGRAAPYGILLVIDQLSALFILIVSICSFLGLVFSVAWIKKDQAKYFVLYFLLQAGMSGIVVAGDLFNMYVFIELSAITSCALLAFGRNKTSMAAAFKYMVFGCISGMAILTAIIILYNGTGVLTLAHIAARIDKVPLTLVVPALILLFLGLGLKIGIVPLHFWLPDAHSSGPWPVSALLSGLLVTTGVYAFIRLFYTVFGVEMLRMFRLPEVMLVMGAVTVVVGHMSAFRQKDIKRILAFSTVAHVGYIFFALGLATPSAVAGGLYHVMNHAFMKGMLFMVAGIIASYAGGKSLDSLTGVAAVCPVYCWMFVLVATAMIGLPPLNGFYSKLVILGSGVVNGELFLSAVIPLGTVISSLYYLKIFSAFFTKVETVTARSKEDQPRLLFFPTAGLALTCIFLGVFPVQVYNWLLPVARTALSRTDYIAHFVK